MKTQRKISIIGSGPAGLTAAIYAARGGLDTTVIAGYQPGGQLMNTTIVENYPGFIDGIAGPELMQNMMLQAQKWGAKIVQEDATEVDLSLPNKLVKTYGGEYHADAVIIATGALPRKLQIPGEEELYGRGVSTCATCDGALYKGKTVAVVGGGDSAMQESIFLSNFAEKVYLIHRRDTFNASRIMQDRALQNPKLEVILNTEIREIVGKDGRLDHLKLFNNHNHSETELKTDGLFLAIGHIPVTGLFKGVALNELGYVQSVDGIHTNIEGVFVAGDVQDAVYRQAITAAGLGAQAAIAAERWLAGKR